MPEETAADEPSSAPAEEAGDTLPDGSKVSVPRVAETWYDEERVGGFADIAALSTALTTAGIVAKAAIDNRAHVRKAEIDAETARVESDAETERTRIREDAETERERIRQQGAGPDPRTP